MLIVCDMCASVAQAFGGNLPPTRIPVLRLLLAGPRTAVLGVGTRRRRAALILMQGFDVIDKYILLMVMFVVVVVALYCTRPHVTNRRRSVS